MFTLRVKDNVEYIDACMHQMDVDCSDSNPFYLHFEFLRGFSTCYLFFHFSKRSFFPISLSLSHFFLSSLAFPSHATPFFHPHISKISFSSYFSVDEFLHVRNFFFLSLLFAFLVSRQCDAMRFRPTRASDPSLCSLCSIGGKRKVVEFSRDRRGGEVGA